MQKFLLIAPLSAQPRPSAPLAADQAIPAPGITMRSRDSFSADDLEQTVETIVDLWTDSTADISTEGSSSVVLSGAVLVSVGGQAFIATSASFDSPHAAAGTVECALTTAVERLVAERFPGISVKWVNRTLITKTTDELDDWLLRDADSQRIEIGSRSVSQVLTLAWGSNLLEAVNGLDASAERQLIAGLIDAQFIWVQLDSIAVSSELMIKAYSGGHQEMLRGARSFEKVRHLSEQMALHHLFYDKVLLNLQGVRGNVARAALKSWRYPDLSERILHRVREVDHLVQQEGENSRRQYQELVENVLLALGVISLVQLVISFAQTAYINGVIKGTGDGADFSVLRFLRNADLDRVLMTSVVLALSLFVWIVWHKRGVR